MPEPIERYWSAQNKVTKFAKEHGLVRDRITWGLYAVLVIVDTPTQWNAWVKHLQDIDPNYQGKWEFHEINGAIAGIPTTIAMFRGRAA